MSYFVTYKRVERSQGLIFFSIYKAPCHCDGFALSQKEEKNLSQTGSDSWYNDIEGNNNLTEAKRKGKRFI